MAEHPIQGLMKTAMESIKGMIDVNTIIGDTIETPDGTVIVPISRVTFGFAAGGGDYDPMDTVKSQPTTHPFGGGSGAGVSVKPVGFLICSSSNGVRFIPVEGKIIFDRIFDLVPQVLDRIEDMLNNREDDNDPKEGVAKTEEMLAEGH